MQARHGSRRRALIAATLGSIALAGCGHFLVPTAFRPVGSGDQIRNSEGTSIEVSDDGTVAWVQDSRIGIAFDKEIDPKQVRARVGVSESIVPTHIRTAPAFTDPQSGKRRL